MRTAVIGICKEKNNLTLGVSVKITFAYFHNTQMIKSHLTPVRYVENLV